MDFADTACPDVDILSLELAPAIERAGIGLVILDDEARIICASERAKSLIGLREGTLETACYFWTVDYADAELISERRRNWDAYIKGRDSWSGPSRWIGKDGSLFYYDLSVSYLAPGQTLAVLIDRTEKVNASLALAEREALHNYILDNIPVSITLQNPDKQIVYTNDLVPRLTGRPKSYFLGKKTIEFIADRHLVRIDDLRAHVIETGEPVTGHAVRISRGPLKDTHWLVHIYPVFDPDNKIIQTLTVAFDRTQRQALLEDKEAYERRLAQVQKMDAINRFAGGLAHEMSNLLHPAGTFAKALAENPDDPARAKHAARIHEAVQKSGEVLRHMLSMSKSDPEGLEADDLNLRTRELVEFASQVAPRGLSYATDFAPLRLTGYFDASELRQVLMNLLVNAAHAQGDKGEITIRTGSGGRPPAGGTLPAPAATGYCWLDVEDAGAGMDPQTLARVFDPFFTTKGRKGTGLGLALVRSQVQGWGGDITVTSSAGKGSVFRVWILLAGDDNITPKEHQGSRTWQKY